MHLYAEQYFSMLIIYIQFVKYLYILHHTVRYLLYESSMVLNVICLFSKIRNYVHVFAHELKFSMLNEERC